MARTDLVDEEAWAEAGADPAKYVDIMRRKGEVEPVPPRVPTHKITSKMNPGRVFP